MRDIFLPLRSNAAFFSTAETRKRLERQIKTNLVLYDRLIVQDGRYRLTASADGEGVSCIVPGCFFGESRQDITYFEPGGRFGVEFGGQVLLDAQSAVAYDVDFYPILHEAELVNAECIQWLQADLALDCRHHAENRAAKDNRHPDLESILPSNPYLKKAVLEGLYVDGIMAQELGTPFCVDYHVAPVVKWKQSQAKNEWRECLPNMFFDRWVELGLPDLSEYSWDQVLSIRDSAAGRSFRDMLESVVERVQDAMEQSIEQCDILELIDRELIQEFRAEVLARRTTAGETILNLTLNCIPWGILPSTVKDIRSLGRERASWISLIQ